MLKSAIMDGSFSSVQADVGYALEELTGKSFDLTSDGIANFEKQWQDKVK